MKSMVLLFFCIMGANSFSAVAAIVNEITDYHVNGQRFVAYIAYDNAIKTKRPGVLVVHEWWGHNKYARKRANMLAELGYTALALDMYGSGKQAAHPDDAGKFAAEVKKNMANAEARFVAAKKLLMAHKTTNAEKIAAIGYCFGGGLVLEMARRGVDLAAVVSFHGSLATQSPAQPSQVKAKVLVCHGESDSFIKPDDISAFKNEMKTANVDFTFNAYANAKHSFTNPGANALGKQFNLPLEYNADADKQSWQDMQVFLQQTFMSVKPLM
ncbi:MAG: dienelactone hydrolase family protein [Gammaproteobacteria bacterium]|nr:dienelactone hydrolase family protein [Gammaproteobacteria bacterium]